MSNRFRPPSICQEHAYAKATDRPKLEHCAKVLRKGDALVAWRPGHLGHNLTDLVDMANELNHQEVYFESLVEWIETKSATGRLIFDVFTSLAEFERNLIRERPQMRLKAARARGRKHKPKLGCQASRKIKAMLSDPISLSEVAKRHSVGRTTRCKYIGAVAPTQGSLSH